MPRIFDRVRLSPTQLRTVAGRRFADAECLRKTGENERANGAMYLGGFVLECLLKAELLEKHTWLQAPLTAAAGPSEQRLWSLCYRSHDLLEILESLPHLLEKAAARDAWEGVGLRNKLVLRCTEWTVHARYSPLSTTMAEAGQFLADIKEIRLWLK